MFNEQFKLFRSDSVVVDSEDETTFATTLDALKTSTMMNGGNRQEASKGRYTLLHKCLRIQTWMTSGITLHRILGSL